MALFSVASQVFEKLPDVCFGVVVAKGIDNATEYPEISSLLQEAAALAYERFSAADLKIDPALAPYRSAFVALGFNPNKFTCSVEALCKRIVKGASMPEINPIVDLGNAMSLRYTLPMGAHDIRKLSGGLEVRFATEDDSFLPFGGTGLEHPDPGELVYVSGNTVKTRRWIWRQGEDGKIDTASSDVIFPIDSFRSTNVEAMLSARDELARRLREYFGCDVTTGLIDADNLSFSLQI